MNDREKSNISEMYILEGSDLSSIGEIDTVTDVEVAGWLPVADLGEASVTLSVDGIEIRTHRAELPDENDDSKRRFGFRIGEKLKELLPINGRIDVCIQDNNISLPFADGISDQYQGHSTDNGETLKDMLEEKWGIDHWGNLHVQFGRDLPLIGRCAHIYSISRKFIRETLDTELYITGGNLLGLVREGKFLDHDDDIDCSLIINAENSASAADQFFGMIEEIAPVAATQGIKLKIAYPLHFYMILPGYPYLDVLVGWLTPEGYWCRPSGYGGDLGITEFKFTEIEYSDTLMTIPTHAERELLLTYGEGWSQKDNAYSKIRPQGPLREIQKLNWSYRDRVEGINSILSSLLV